MSDILYLKSLEANPTYYGRTSNWSNKPMGDDEIHALEACYNAGAPFPLALKELLRLAGGRCYVLDFGLSDTRQELQEDVRELLRDAGRIMPKAFFAIDVYNFGDQFLFVYMDEGEDPPLYEARYWDHPYTKDWIKLIRPTLSGYIDRLVKDVQQGLNPF